MKNIKVLIVDDHKIVRSGLKMIFDDVENIEVVGEAEHGIQAVEFIKNSDVNIVISDLTMPVMNGIELTKKLKVSHPNIKILMLSMHNDDQYVIDALESGVKGYLPKDSDHSEIIEAVETLALNKMYFASSISSAFANRILKRDKKSQLVASLTQREVEIVELIVKGYSNKEIAEKLFLSKRTVDNHRTNCMKKINAKNTADIVRIAISSNLVKID